jgi:hypothetical protein
MQAALCLSRALNMLRLCTQPCIHGSAHSIHGMYMYTEGDAVPPSPPVLRGAAATTSAAPPPPARLPRCIHGDRHAVLAMCMHAHIRDACCRLHTAGDAVPPVTASAAWRSSHNISRTRMMDLLTRVTGSGAGSCEAALFNGLRVRMVSSAESVKGGERVRRRGSVLVHRWSLSMFLPHMAKEFRQCLGRGARVLRDAHDGPAHSGDGQRSGGLRGGTL